MVTLRAIVEGGQLRLLDPLELPEGQQVRVRVEPMSEEQIRIREALGDRVRWANPDAFADDDVDEEALAREIEEAFRGLPSLSELIIQERREGP